MSIQGEWNGVMYYKEGKEIGTSTPTEVCVLYINVLKDNNSSRF